MDRENEQQISPSVAAENEIEHIRDLLREVIDPELGLNIIDLGLVYDIQLQERQVYVRMTLTTPGCPMLDTIVGGVKYVLRDYEEVNVEVVWEPRWHPGLISDEGRDQLLFF